MLNDAAADAALDTWIAGLSPPAADPVKTRDAMRGLVRAIYSGIVANAVVHADGAVPMTADGDPVVGTGRIT